VSGQRSSSLGRAGARRSQAPNGPRTPVH
jgi:hypothetical protein